MQNLRVDVSIKEKLPLKFVKIAPIRNVNDAKINEEYFGTVKVNFSEARVSYFPSASRQKELARFLRIPEDEGLSGQFIVQYDVKRDSSRGEVSWKGK